MNKYPNKDVEEKIKEVEAFAKKNDLHYLYIYSDNEAVDEDVMYSNYIEYLINMAYHLKQGGLFNVLLDSTDKYIIYIDGTRFCSKNA